MGGGVPKVIPYTSGVEREIEGDGGVPTKMEGVPSGVREAIEDNIIGEDTCVCCHYAEDAAILPTR